jgi:hypothetical protein
MLELILPAGVESEERFGPASGGVLFPEEEEDHRSRRAGTPP